METVYRTDRATGATDSVPIAQAVRALAANYGPSSTAADVARDLESGAQLCTAGYVYSILKPLQVTK